MLDTEHVSDFIPAYALGCLDDEEIAQVGAHLAVCESCRAELKAYEEIVGQLPVAVADIEPPGYVKTRLFQRVAEIRAGTRDVEVSGAPGGALARQQIDSASARDEKNWLGRLVDRLHLASPAWGLASLALVILLFASNILLWRQVTQLQEPALQTISMSGTDAAPGATGLIVVSVDGEHGTLVVDGLPALGDDQQYQLWLIRGDHRDSGAVFSVSNSGYGSVWVNATDPLISYPAFGVTIEPEGGSPGPTGLKVLGGEAAERGSN